MTIQPSEHPRRTVTDVVRSNAPLWVLRRIAEATGRPFVPPVGRVKFGSVGQTTPINNNFGYSRGRPIDRWYIEQFLAIHSDNITGHVLEVKDDSYTRRFGGDRVRQGEVVDIDGTNKKATIVADLSQPGSLPNNTFDCVVLTQTLHLIFEMEEALTSIHDALRPGGALLLTVPGISPVHRSLADRWYWSLTPASVSALLSSAFHRNDTIVEHYGNVLAAIAFLQGLGAEEIGTENLRVIDPEYPIIVAARVVKSTNL